MISKTAASRSVWRPLIGAYGLSLLAILLFACFPVLSVAIAAGVAEVGDCHLDEGSVNPCVIGGVDLGGVLTDMEVLGWLMIATLPTGALLLACWCVALMIQLVAIYRKRQARS